MKVRKKKKRPIYHCVGTASVTKDSMLVVNWRGAIRYFSPLLIFCWPILYLFYHVFPINGQYTRIGNDFIALYYKYKVHLLGHLADLSFPFWSPAEGCGFPFYTNPFTQAFYPLNLLLVAWYKISGGYNVLDHQLFAVIGISIFALGLFMWLRLANSNLRAVVFSVLVMSVSFKVTEILRFPNAIHSAAWYPWILYALTKIMLSRSLRNAALGGVLLTVFMICLCTAGYPYYIYYSLFLFIPYVLVFLVKPLRLRLFDVPVVPWKRVFGTLVVAGLVTVLICGPYLLGIKNLMYETVDRTGKDFNFSTQHTFNLEDTLGSLIYPPAASPEGWYFFSITALLLIILYLLSESSLGRTPPKIFGYKKQTKLSTCTHDPRIKLFFVLWIGTITYITYGRNSYLFILLWKYMPGFSSLRVWPRLNIILVPIFTWLLALAYESFESQILRKTVVIDTKSSRLFALILKVAFIYAGILGVQLYFYLNKVYDPYWHHYFKNVSTEDIKFIIHGTIALAVILSFLILYRWFRFKKNLYRTALLIVLVIVSIIEMRPVGTNMWTRQGRKTNRRIHLDVTKINQDSFSFCRTDHKNTISLTPQFSVGVIPNWYYSRYVKFLKQTNNESEAQKILLGVKNGRKIFFSKSIMHNTIKSFLCDTLRYPHTGHLLLYTGDELNWEVDAPTEGYLSFIDNWDPAWKVCVDKEPAEIKLLFGTFKSVRLTQGKHRVRFYYQPEVMF